ncbi:MAG: thioesterase family protein [Congregibacter sp.]
MQPFEFSIAPRFYETDAQGHINNATLAAWFEVARTRFLESVLDGDGPAPTEWMLASVHIDYLGETFFGEDVQLRIVEASVGNSSLTVSCEMWQEERHTVRGKAVLVHFDRETQSSKRIPDSLRERLA